MKKNIKPIKYIVCLTFLLMSCNIIHAQFPAVWDTNLPSNASVNNQHIIAQNGYLGDIAEGEYSIWYGCDGNAIRNQIEKPFIWVEGINLQPNNYQRSNYANSEAFSNRLYTPLMQRGFDIVQLDFSTNPTYIQRNAELLVTLIDQLNVPDDQEIVIMGTSMGAMVARYALTSMENNGINHNVRLLISHDGPNNGANIPYGMQYMFQDLTTNNLTSLFAGTLLIAGITNTFAALYGGTGTSGYAAAFQLLNGSPNLAANVFRTNFENDLLNIGDYPNNCRIVAIANGSNNGVGHANQSSQLFRITTATKDRRAYAAPGINIFGVGTGIVYSRLGVLNNSVSFYPQNLQNFDVAPGGTLFEDQQYGVVSTEPFTFIPVISALDLNTNNPYYNVSGIAGFNTTMIPDYASATGTIMIDNAAYTHSNPISPFDAIWADDVNTYHALLEGSADFILQEVAPTTLVIQNRIIDGDITFDATGQILVGNNVSPAFPVGDVVFQNGINAEIWTGNEIYIQDGFHAQAGSEVNLTINNYNCQ